MHDCPYGRVTPKTNAEFWQNKRRGNVERDAKNEAALKEAGWQILNIWECMTKARSIADLPDVLKKFLD